MSSPGESVVVMPLYTDFVSAYRHVLGMLFNDLRIHSTLLTIPAPFQRRSLDRAIVNGTLSVRPSVALMFHA